MLIRKSHFTFL